MGNLIMPKQTAKLDRFYYSLEIFYKAYKRNDPDVPNADFKQQITSHFEDLRDRNDGAKIVKQSEMTRYFGMAYHSYARNITTITERGIKFFESYQRGNSSTCVDLIVESVINDSFGRGNTAIKSSDADVDPPKLFTRGIIDLDGITRSDLALLLYYIHDMQLSYDDACMELNKVRSSSDDATVIVTPEKVNKYGDPKFSVFLANIGFCEIDSNKKYRLSHYVLSSYYDKLKSLNIYNKTPAIIHYSNSTMFADNSTETKDTDCGAKYKENVSQTVAYDINSSTFNRQNNRTPSADTADKVSHRYPTDTRIAKTALMIASYKCEHDPTHITFTSKNDTPFMEAHHLIPMTAQKDFSINLDRVENIICLCPNCHSQIHYGSETERKTILSKLFRSRRDELDEVGLDINFEELFQLYYN